MTDRTPAESSAAAAQHTGTGPAAEGESKVSDVTSVRAGGRRKPVAPEQVLQRVVFPRGEDPLDVRPLYIDEPASLHSTATVVSRRCVRVPAHSKISFATYFNAFPASYWKRWTKVDEVVLRMKVTGSGRLDVYRSKPNGDSVHLQGTPVSSPDEWTSLEFRVALTPFEDGGWIWFDVFTNDSSLTVDEASWTTDVPLPRQKVVVGTTTIRPADCILALRTLGEDPQVMDVVEKVVVADQGP